MPQQRFSVRTYLRDYAASCDGAMDQAGAIIHDLRVGAAAVRLRFAGPALVPLAHPLAHLIHDSPASANPHLAVDLWDAESTGVFPPPFPCGGDPPGKGELRGYDEAAVRIRFASGVGSRDGAFAAMAIFDERASVVRHFVNAPAWIPWYERASPLRDALQWGLTRPDRVLVHAGAVGVGGRGVLLVGRSGSGKSTTAVAALLSGLDYLGDDYTLLDVAGPQPIAHSLYATAKLAPDTLALLPGLAHTNGLTRPPDADKLVLDVTAVRAGALRRSMRITAIVVPQVRPGDTVMERISPGAALLAVAPTTVLQAPQPTAAELGPLTKLVRRVPSYRLNLRHALDRVGPTIEQILDQGDLR